jgi:hypothetical protein
MKIIGYEWEGGIRDNTPVVHEVSASLLRQFEEHVETCPHCDSTNLDFDIDGATCLDCAAEEDET